MIIQQSQNGLITERKTSFKKKMHILSEKIPNKKIFSKKNSFKNNIFKKPSIDIKNISKNNTKYQSQTIIPNNHNYNRIKFKNFKQDTNNSNISKNISIINLNEKKNNNNYNESIYDNGSDKENKINNIPHTSRYDNNTKEKYLSKLFNHFAESNYKTLFDKNINYNIPNKLMKTINAHSKRYKSTYITPIWKDYFNKIDNNNNNCNSSDINTNESIINLEDQLNYEFEIRLLKKKYKEVKKRNDKLKYKIIKSKNEQKKKKNSQNKQKKKEYIISQVIEICKNINNSYKNNYFSTSKESYNGNTNSNLNNSMESKNDGLNKFPATRKFKNMLLNLMDLKYEYENILLKNEFIEGVNNIIERDNKNNVNNIYKNIKALLKEEIKMKTINKKYQYLSLENKKYYDYFTKLCKKLCVRGLDNLDLFIKNTFTKIQAEFNQINQIKKIVLSNDKNNNLFNDNYKINNNGNNIYNYSQSYQPLRNTNFSESQINKNRSSILKEEDKNCKRYSYFKDNRYESKFFLDNNNIYRNKDNNNNKRLFFTYRYNDSSENNKNKRIIKQNTYEQLNLYDFNKKNNYDKYIKAYYNNDIICEKDANKNINKNEIPFFNKNIKIPTFENVKSNKNKNYNNIINIKKKELGLNSKIKSKMKLNSKDIKNKKISKSHSNDFFIISKNIKKNK